MAVLRTLTPLAALVAYAEARAFAYSNVGDLLARGPQSCDSDIPMSCHNTTVVEDTCCFIPQGQLLQTQFWDTDPVTGPTDSWTIHGLWPDNCDGTYEAECAPDRAYTDISDIVSSMGAEGTLDYMKTYWKDYEGDDETFWEHEWSKHGTCISTLDPSCYSNYQKKQEAAAFFDKTVSLFKTLPTYKWLAAAGITPSDSKTYDADEIQKVLKGKHGAEVTLGCDGDTFNEVWYHYNVKGSLQEGEFVPAAPDGTKSTCSGSVSYVPKTGGNATVV